MTALSTGWPQNQMETTVTGLALLQKLIFPWHLVCERALPHSPKQGEQWGVGGGKAL